MMITYQAIDGSLPPTVLDAVLSLYAQVFSAQDTEALAAEIKERKHLFTLVAWKSGKMAGFKIGYRQKKNQFYSWLGGVDDAFRKQGIGASLMKQQHAWCRQAGYQIIQTKTTNRWRSMLVLNLKNGFNIIGTYVDRQGEVKIILEKVL